MNLTFNPACRPVFKQLPKRPNEGYDRVATVQDLNQMEDRNREQQKQILENQEHILENQSYIIENINSLCCRL